MTFLEQHRLSGGKRPHSPGGYPPFGSAGRTGGVTVGDPIVKWSDLACWIAEQIKNGIQPLPLPPISELKASIFQENRIEYRFFRLVKLFTSPDAQHANSTDQLCLEDAFELLNRLTETYPSVPWSMPQYQVDEAVQLHEQIARKALVTTARIRSQKPPTEEIPLTSGTFHEALRAYKQKRRADFTTTDKMDGSGHHMLGLIENFLKRQQDVPLALLDFARCQEIYDFWRKRPPSMRLDKPLSIKHCTSHIGELNRFFSWLRTTDKFAWEPPKNFDLIESKVKKLASDRPSIKEIELKTYTVDQLRLLYKHALPAQRLKIAWCLNCSHGAAEIGRVEWYDLFLNTPHPWAKEGLEVVNDENDSWCGLLRPKTDVVGWWWLWPETVKLVQWWKNDLQQKLKRELQPSERMLLTDTGANLYRDSSRNAQSSFSNEWRRLLTRVAKVEGKDAVPRLPFGTLRDQMSNWLGSDKNRAVLASVGLAHGIPHKGDKLLYKHYSNRPWAQFFEAQKEYRQYLQPIFTNEPSLTKE